MAYTPAQKDETRRQIAEVCAQQIRDKGLAAVSARTVAGEMERAQSWLYKLFPDFDHVVLAANAITLAELDQRLSATAEAHLHHDVAERFLALAMSYLQFSQDEPRRWAALFEHQMQQGRDLPLEHKQEHYILFRHVEAPLAKIMPNADRSLIHATARTIYSAVHGVVSLSLQGRLDRVPLDMLEKQLRMLTSAFAEGYARLPDA
ncbi:TetR/AcrR family transcriptional regulator [Oryzifoliimicrobium ureilyticus]|uniref:TetR/AcrR family transcriptional regulator n=1 Tax=Oryzifoliimicrobium ureilyticus TaxID=3113724 RepID=UPI0030767E81